LINVFRIQQTAKCTHKRTHTHTRAHTHKHTNTHAHAHAKIYTHTHIEVHISVYIHRNRKIYTHTTPRTLCLPRTNTNYAFSNLYVKRGCSEEPGGIK